MDGIASAIAEISFFVAFQILPQAFSRTTGSEADAITEMKSSKKIVYLLTEDWFFCSHFIERANAAKAAGYDVVVVARETVYGILFVQLVFDLSV